MAHPIPQAVLAFRWIMAPPPSAGRQMMKGGKTVSLRAAR